MKIKDYLILLIVFIIPISILNITKVSAAGDWSTAYAYQIQILTYNGTGEPKKIGKPILIYHPDLFQEFTIEYSTDVPGSYNDLMSKNYGLSQMINTNANNVMYDYDDNNDSGDLVEGIEDNPNLHSKDVNAVDQYGTPIPSCSSGQSSGCINPGIYYEVDTLNPDTGEHDRSKCGYQEGQTVTNKSQATGHAASYQSYIFRYMSGSKKVTYKKEDIDTSPFYKIIEDSNLTENTVKNNNYLYTLYVRYANSKSKIKEYFNIDIDFKIADQYYVEIEPVVRVLETNINKMRVTGNYLIGDRPLENPQKYPDYLNGYGSNSCDSSSYNCLYWSSVEIQDADICGREPGSYQTSDCYNTFKQCNSDCNSSSNPEHPSALTNVSAKHYVCSWWKDGEPKKCDVYTSPTVTCGTRSLHYIYGRTADGPSYLRTALEAGSDGLSKLDRAVNLCEENKHCELEDDNKTCKRDSNGNIIYQYYIGPSLEKALVGTETYNKYKLQGTCTPLDATWGKRDFYEIHDWSDDCTTICTVSGDKRSDEFLKCAENYCDAEVDFELKGNAQKRKKECLLNCGYEYVTQSCKNTNPYKGQDKYYAGTSKCNINGEKYQPMTGEQATAVTCIGDNVNDFAIDQTNDTIFDQRKYINIACKETTSFQYSDLSKLSLNAGEDIEYIVKLLGEKECTVYLNLTQWKFDYATISSKDPDRRRRLMYIYEVFNRALDDTYTPNSSNNKYFDKDFLDEENGEVKWESLKYDKNNVSVMSKVTEIINNKESQVLETQNLNGDDYVEKSDQNIWFRDSNDKNSNYLTAIKQMGISYYPVNKYKSTSKVEVNYRFNKMCTTTDGKADAYLSNVDVCYTKKDGSSVFAKNTYYTSLAATPNKYFSEDIIKAGKSHNVQTTATVEGGSDTDFYYENAEKCEYKIKEPTEAQCKIIITPNQDTAKLGHDIYEGSGVTAKVWYYEELGEEDKVESVAMIVNNTRYETNERSIAIGSILNSNEEFNITGVVTTKKGKEIECPKTIIVMRHTSCGLGCTIARVGDKAENLYEIRSTGLTPNHYYQSLATNMNKVEVFPSVADGRYYVRLGKDVSATTTHEYNANILFGYVYTNNCNDYCRTPIGEEIEQPDCTNMYKPSETGEIRTYCERNYQDDINNYESVEDCVMRCSNARECPDNRRDITEVRTFCKTNYLGLGYSEEIECVNRCYYNPKSKEDYIFRPVSQLDPFPNSEESYTPGNRVIGQNWYGGLSKYITEDNDDKTSVTGAGANQNVEYIIELNPQTIRKVRENSKDYGIAAYTDYIYAETYDEDYVGRYESKFIREDFRDLFKTSMESAGRTISALGELD